MNHLFQFFFGEKPKEDMLLAPPVSIRLPEKLLKEINIQSEQIGGERYRSKHFISLMEIGVKYFSAKTELLRSLPLNQFRLHLRLGYVFYKLNLNPSIVAENWGHPNVSQWCSWLDGSETPSFDVLERLADEYCLDANWLKHGSKDKDCELGLHLVCELPRKCYGSFYELAKFIFNLRSTKIQTIRVIRNKLDGSLLIDLEYSYRNSITVDCSGLRLLDEETLGSSGLAQLKEFILFMAIFKKNKNFPYTYSISDQYFKQIKCGETTFSRMGFLAKDAFEFNSSEQWAHILVEHDFIKDMDNSRLWLGGKDLLNTLYSEDQEFREKVVAIQECMEQADVPAIYFKESIELFSNFNKDFYSKKQSLIALDIPSYFSSNDNYLISGSGSTGFIHFSLKLIEHKLNCHDGLIYINGTGCENDLNIIKRTLAILGKDSDLYNVDLDGVHGLKNAIQNKKVIYIGIEDPNNIEKARDYLSYIFDALYTALNQKYYVTEKRSLTIFTNECVELFGDYIGRFYNGNWESIDTNLVNTDRTNLYAKLENKAFNNSDIYNILLENSKQKIVYRPNDNEEEEIIRKKIPIRNLDSLLNLNDGEFVLLDGNRHPKITQTKTAVFLERSKLNGDKGI